MLENCSNKVYWVTEDSVCRFDMPTVITIPTVLIMLH